MPTAYPLIRGLLFRFDPERVHELANRSLSALPRSARVGLYRRFGVRDPRLGTRLWGIDFPNPVGLAAGFDKSGEAFNGLASLGFGFVEIGTVTARAQPGNPRPRLFRLPQDRALLNRMGFNNPGAQEVASRLSVAPRETILGVNIGKSKVIPLDAAVDDYLRSVDLLAPLADYLVVNVSSPNTPGLRELQDAGPLRSLLGAVVAHVGQSPPGPPVLLKLAPDLSDAQIDQATGIAQEEGAAGIIAVNTTVSREGLRTPATVVQAMGAGGVSGRPVAARALEVVERIRRRSQGQLPIIGVGGIFNAQDAWDRICAGANLVQLYTGFIYEGPAAVKRINQGLLERLTASGFSALPEAVGSALREI